MNLNHHLRVALEAQDCAALLALLSGKNIEIKRDVFHLIPTHPQQRDTDRRVKDWKRRRSPRYRKTHSDVTIVIVPDGRLYKLDGHTRDALWESGWLDRPPGDLLNVTIKHADSYAEAVDMIHDYDADVAVETNTHKLQGVLREHDETFRSSFISADGVRYAYAINIGHLDWIEQRGRPLRSAEAPLLTHIYDLYMPALRALSRLGASPKTFQAQMLSAALVTIVLDGKERALDGFWAKYLDPDAHDKRGTAKNAFQHLAELRASRYMHHYSGDQMLPNIMRVLRVYEEHFYRVDATARGSAELTPFWGMKEYRKKGLYSSNRPRIDMNRYNLETEANLRRRIAAISDTLRTEDAA